MGLWLTLALERSTSREDAATRVSMRMKTVCAFFDGFLGVVELRGGTEECAVLPVVGQLFHGIVLLRDPRLRSFEFTVADHGGVPCACEARPPGQAGRRTRPTCDPRRPCPAPSDWSSPREKRDRSLLIRTAFLCWRCAMEQQTAF